MIEPIRIGLLGIGTIGRALLKNTLGNPKFKFVALGDTSGTVAKEEGFTINEISKILELKKSKGSLIEYSKNEKHYDTMEEVLGEFLMDSLVDVTASQTFDLINRALDYTSVVTANKIPIADVKYSDYKRLISKAKNNGKILDLGTTVGAGMRIPDIIKGMGVNGVDRLTGCLSGTMSFISQRLNQGETLSSAVREAMQPPRSYTEPDPRVDLGGLDFGRKLVILTRICGNETSLADVKIQDLVPKSMKTMLLGDFLDSMGAIDHRMGTLFGDARMNGKVIWYVGTADLMKKKYTIGFEEFPANDPIASSKESNNVLKIYPTGWIRPVSIIGPGAGPAETVSGLVRGLEKISENF
jgi:aspartokinase/homoserine dehydrogenase 1